MALADKARHKELELMPLSQHAHLSDAVQDPSSSPSGSAIFAGLLSSSVDTSGGQFSNGPLILDSRATKKALTV